MTSLSALTDTELTLLLNAGDRRAFEAVYDRYWAILFRHARKLLQDEVAAKDVVQEVFTSLWIRLGQGSITPPLAALLYTMTRNKVLDMVKHSKVRDKYLASLQRLIESGQPLPESQFIEKELFGLIEREIAQLPAKMRLIFQLSRQEHKSHKDIALLLGLSEKTVKKQVGNALRILKGRLGDSLGIFLSFF